MARLKEDSKHKTNSSIVMTSRIRLARNIAGRRFANAATREALEEVFDSCAKVLSGLRKFRDGELYRINDLSEFSRTMLFEDRSISKELLEGGAGRGVYVSKDGSASAMINEEDHLRIQVISKGQNLPSIWRSINALDDAVEKSIEYAYSPEYGYLTACPTNVGTGIRVSLMMHLPALVFSNQMEKVIRGVNQIGMVVRGANGEGSESHGAVFQISNQQTLGMSEDEIIKRITKYGKLISQFETNARLKMLEDKPAFLHDKFARAAAILKSCKLIDTAEALTYLSHLRLAADMGLMDGGAEFIGELDALMTTVLPSHLQLEEGVYDASPEMRDTLRAQLLNERAAKFPALKLNRR